MTSLTASRPAFSLPARSTLLAASAAGISALILAAMAHRVMATGTLASLAIRSPWLALHLATVVPALPLGAYILARRKGDRLHKMLGKIWAVLMIVGALSSFGLVGLMGHLSPIHLLSVITLIGVPRAIVMARRGDIKRHVGSMTRVYIGLVSAGLFAFLPGRIFGVWLFG